RTRVRCPQGRSRGPGRGAEDRLGAPGEPLERERGSVDPGKIGAEVVGAAELAGCRAEATPDEGRGPGWAAEVDHRRHALSRPEPDPAAAPGDERAEQGPA